MLSTVLLILLASLISANAQVTCSSTCATAQQVAQETTNYQQGVAGAKCLFIYNDKIYRPPTGTISNGIHKNAHPCGADVTGIMRQSHLSDPNKYLTPYVCAPLCTGATTTVPTTVSTSVAPTTTIIGGGTTTILATSTVIGGATTTVTASGGTTSIMQSTTSVIRLGSGGDCLPYCPEACGQDNGCGGKCPNSDVYKPGKCGTSSCIPSCPDGFCGQQDGCGGICANTDANSCGLCGNPSCCLPEEICDDDIDNNCNNQIDEACGIGSFITDFPSSWNATSRMTRANLEESGKLIKKPNILTRIFGLAAFFFAGLTLLVGIFRYELIKRFSRKEVIKYHAVLGFYAIFFAMSHIVTVLLDKGGWAETVTLRYAFIPEFSGYVLFNAALGTIGLYLLLFTILSGIFFVKLSRIIGYKYWLLVHRGSFVFYGFIFLHSYRIGTDFRNPYIMIFFLHVFLVILFYIAYRAKKFRLSRIKDELSKIAQTFKVSEKALAIGDIISRPELLGKNVITKGNIGKIPLQQVVKEDWYQIYDEYTSMFALVPGGTKPDYYSYIEGTVKKEGEQIYIEVKKLKK